MTLERPPLINQDDPERINRWLYLLWTLVTTQSSGTAETNHAALGNLNSTNYTHLTANQATALTTGNNATIHYHASDRDRANHTGSQPSSTISDFITAVSNATLTLGAQGASIASANNLTLGSDGNYFQITGATQINLIDTSNWLGGAWVTLKFNSTPTVKHNQAASGAFKPIMLAGAADFAATANDTLTLRYDSTDSKWYEISRAVI